MDEHRVSRLLASGSLATEQVAFAASLGSREAIAADVGIANLPRDFQQVVELGVDVLPSKTAVIFAIECAERTLGVWTEVFQSDNRPFEAILEAKSWLNGNSTTSQLEERGYAAGNSAKARRKSLQNVELEQELVRAIYAADSAAHASHAACEASKQLYERSPKNSLQCAVGYAARFAALAQDRTLDEEAWQKHRLAELVLQGK